MMLPLPSQHCAVVYGGAVSANCTSMGDLWCRDAVVKCSGGGRGRSRRRSRARNAEEVADVVLYPAPPQVISPEPCNSAGDPASSIMRCLWK